MVIGLSCAIVLTLCRLSNSRVLQGFATTWVEIARNTPALFQIYMAHFGLGSFGIHLSPYVSLADRALPSTTQAIWPRISAAR